MELPVAMNQPTKTERLRALPMNKSLFQKIWQSHQQQYLRKRLKAIERVWSGESRLTVCKTLPCAYESLDSWINVILTHGADEGLRQLVKARTRTVKWRLSDEQRKELQTIITKQQPSDYQLDDPMWTANSILELISRKWHVEYKQRRIYDILHSFNLSYQKDHRDYAEADPKKQWVFVQELKKNSR
jgi:transposase